MSLSATNVGSSTFQTSKDNIGRKRMKYAKDPNQFT